MKMRLGLAALLSITAGAAAQNNPLKLEYCTQPGGLGTVYTFKLTLDNHDNSWVAGQGWGWIMFGDIINPTGTPPIYSLINDFVADPSYWPAGPFDSLTSAGGYHNGPTLGPIIVPDPDHPDPNDPLHWIWVAWYPAAVGDSITWGGTSATLVPDGQMQWSALVVHGGASGIEFANATHINCGGEECYANCDESTATPVLTANDFQCFLNRYAAGTSDANCDGSTSIPLLTANDFQCFLNKYAAGCT